MFPFLQPLLELLGRGLLGLLVWGRLLMLLCLNRWCLTHLSFESPVLDVLISSNVNSLNLIDLFKEVGDVGAIKLRASTFLRL